MKSCESVIFVLKSRSGVVVLVLVKRQWS